MRTVFVVLLPLLLAACSLPLRSTHEAAPLHTPVVYSCEDGLQLRVRLLREGAHVTLPSGENVFLPREQDGTYRTAQHELRDRSGEVTWSSGRRVPVGCRIVR